MLMPVFVVILKDRHTDDSITVHETREGADKRVEKIIAALHRSFGEPAATWIDRDYGRTQGWLRYLDTGNDDGPKIRIEQKELLP